MNDDLQKQLAELLKQLMAVANNAGQWAAGQIPPLVHEKIAYGRASETLGLAMTVALMIFGWKAASRFFAMGLKADFDEEGKELAGIFGTIGGVVAFVLGVIGVFVQADATLKVWFAPRLYIVDWLTSLVKK